MTKRRKETGMRLNGSTAQRLNGSTASLWLVMVVAVAAWGGATPAYPALGLHDLNDDGVITGADLGLLLASWGTGGPWVECGGAAVSSLEIEVISLATIELGLADMDALMAWMDAMTPEQRAYVALYLKMRAAAIAAEEER